MEKGIGVLWIGGDERQLVAANTMQDMGWNCSVCMSKNASLAKGKSYTDLRLAFEENQVLVFPLPASKKRGYLNASQEVLLSDTFVHILPNSLVLGGMLSEEVRAELSAKGIRFVDYYGDEFQIRNALPTAEAAIGIALLESPRMLFSENVLVVGYGKIGKILAQKLQLLGAKVTVGARKTTDLATARAFGHTTVSIATGIPRHMLGNFGLVVNTAPVCLFGRGTVEHLNKEAIYIELASAPYGIDFEAASERGVRTILAESLPGKYSPISAGEILAETVVQILDKEGISP